MTVPSPGRGPEPGVQLWVAASHPHLGQSVSLSLARWSWRGPTVQLRPIPLDREVQVQLRAEDTDLSGVRRKCPERPQERQPSVAARLAQSP